MNVKRLIIGLSALLIVIGLLLVCLTYGGFFNPVPANPNRADYLGWRLNIAMDYPGPCTGLVLINVGTVGLLFVLCLHQRRGRPRRLFRDFLLVYSLYVIVLGGLLVTLMPGGFANPMRWHQGWRIMLDLGGPIIGWVLLGIGAVGLIILWSLNPPAPEPPPLEMPRALREELPPPPAEWQPESFRSGEPPRRL